MEDSEEKIKDCLNSEEIKRELITLFDMFLTTVLKRLEGESFNLVTFNINLRSIQKSYFWFPRLSDVTIATSLSGSTRDFLKLSFDMFPYNEILKVFKSKILLNI